MIMETFCTPCEGTISSVWVLRRHTTRVALIMSGSRDGAVGSTKVRWRHFITE